MFPLTWLFLGWIVLVGIFGIMAFFTLITTLRYGLSCHWTYIASGLFLFVSLVVMLAVINYATSVDLTQSFDPMSLIQG